MEPDMTDLEELSRLDPARGREPDSFERLRSEIALDQIIEGRRPRGRAWPSAPRLVAIGAVAAAVAVAGLIAVPTLFPSAADKAFASWTATPTPVSAQEVLPDARTCVGTRGEDSAAVTAADIIVAERRGTATSLIVRHGPDALECMSVEAGKIYASQLLPGTPLTPPNGLLSIDTRSSNGSGDLAYSHVVGFLTGLVKGVDLILPDGRTVHASTADGWWTAWWPGAEAGQADTVRVVAHTTNGSTTYRIAQLDH